VINEPRDPIMLHGFVLDSSSGACGWMLWVQEDGKGDGADRLFAGRVKFQDDPIATTHAVLQDALQKLEATLGRATQPRLF
jgi:hypothetical protein